MTVSVDLYGGLWTCSLQGRECVSRRLDLEAAGPDDDWYIEHGYWDEMDGDDDDGYVRERLRIAPDELADLVTVTELDGRPVVITGGGRFDFNIDDDPGDSGGIVRVWDLHTGRRVGKPMIGHILGVRALIAVPSDRGLLSISSCELGEVLAFDLVGGEQIMELHRGELGLLGAAFIDGQTIAAVGGADESSVEIWDVLDGQQIGEPLSGIERPYAAALIELGGRTVVVAGGKDTMLHRWDLATREPIGAPLTGHTGQIVTVHTMVVGGRPIAVTGGDPGDNDATRVWDLERAEQIGAMIDHYLPMITEIAGMPVIVTKTADSDIHLWDLTLAAR